MTTTLLGDSSRYQLGSRIATGGMGQVWRGTDTLLDRDVAVKVLKDEYADDPVFRERFRAEARNAAALHHVNVAAVWDFGEVETGDGSGSSRPFIVMELVDGQPLSALLSSGEPLAPQVAANLVAQAADGIAAAHAMGVVHRDVKPANLLVTPEGIVRVTDFGISRALGSSTVTQTGQIIGTPHYVSPEQVEGQPASESSDIYALGVVLYECLAGRRPFQGDSAVAIAVARVHQQAPPLPAHVPQHLRLVVERALARDPADRFANAEEMARALRGAPVLAPTVEAADDVGERRPRVLPAWWVLAAAVGAIAMLLGGVALLSGGSRTSQAPSEAASPAEPLVRLRPAEFVGRPVADVQRELESRGFEVRLQARAATSPDVTADTVAAVRPRGLVEPDATVTVVFWEAYVAPDPPEDVAPTDPSTGGADTDSGARQPADEAPASTPEPAEGSGGEPGSNGNSGAARGDEDTEAGPGRSEGAPGQGEPGVPGPPEDPGNSGNPGNGGGPPSSGNPGNGGGPPPGANPGSGSGASGGTDTGTGGTGTGGTGTGGTDSGGTDSGGTDSGGTDSGTGGSSGGDTSTGGGTAGSSGGQDSPGAARGDSGGRG